MARVEGVGRRDLARAGARAARPRPGRAARGRGLTASRGRPPDPGRGRPPDPGRGDRVTGAGSDRALPRSFYDRHVLDVARDLVGCVVRHGDTAGRIVETEAYHETEAACHAYVGLTGRTKPLFGPPGIAYVYRSYGIHALLNAVCSPPGEGAAVLLRALEPVDGIEVMRARRRVARDADLCNGPGKLTQALGIELLLNESSLMGDGPITIGPRADGSSPPRLIAGERIGITRAVELPWRFCDADAAHWISAPRPRELRGARRRSPART